MINREQSGTNQLGPSVPYSKLYCLASSSDKLLMYIGWLASCVNGLGMPSFVFLIGNVLDSFDPNKSSPQEMLDTISLVCLIFVMIGLCVLFFSYVSYGFLLMFSERVGTKIRIKYL